MPRQDVPYGGAICRLRERIAEIFDLLGQKLHSINGVQGDGQGNVTLKSGDPAIVINNDQAQHEIEIGFNAGLMVTSVNGQVGAVDLDAADIKSEVLAADNTVEDDLNGLNAKFTDGSVTKVGIANVGTDTKPIKLVGGVPTAVTNDLVDTATAQTIKATKSFIPASGSGVVTVGIDAGDSSTARTNGTVVIKTNAGDRAYLNNYEDASNIITQLTSIGNTAQSFEIISNKTSNEGFSKTPYRAYNAANIYDIVTIGSLAANPSVIHATGNEFKSGDLSLGSGASYMNLQGAISNQIARILKHNGVTDNVAFLDVRILNDNTAQLVLCKNINGTETSTVIASL